MKTLISTLFLGLIILSSCGSANVKEPEYRDIREVRLMELGVLQSTAGIDLVYYNPNNFGVQLAEARGDGTLVVANLLCPGNTVVSGSAGSIDEICRLAESQGLRAIRLAVSGAFHTNLMKPADEKLAAVLAGITIQPPRIPVWSNVDGKPHTDPDEIRSLLVKQVVSPVLWESTLRGMLEVGHDKFYEIGPGRVLAGLMKRVHRKTDVTNVQA